MKCTIFILITYSAFVYAQFHKLFGWRTKYQASMSNAQSETSSVQSLLPIQRYYVKPTIENGHYKHLQTGNQPRVLTSLKFIGNIKNFSLQTRSNLYNNKNLPLYNKKKYEAFLLCDHDETKNKTAFQYYPYLQHIPLCIIPLQRDSGPISSISIRSQLSTYSEKPSLYLLPPSTSIAKQSVVYPLNLQKYRSIENHQIIPYYLEQTTLKNVIQSPIYALQPPTYAIQSTPQHRRIYPTLASTYSKPETWKFWWLTNTQSMKPSDSKSTETPTIKTKVPTHTTLPLKKFGAELVLNEDLQTSTKTPLSRTYLTVIPVHPNMSSIHVTQAPSHYITQITDSPNSKASYAIQPQSHNHSSSNQNIINLPHLQIFQHLSPIHPTQPITYPRQSTQTQSPIYSTTPKQHTTQYIYQSSYKTQSPSKRPPTYSTLISVNLSPPVTFSAHSLQKQLTKNSTAPLFYSSQKQLQALQSTSQYATYPPSPRQPIYSTLISVNLSPPANSSTYSVQEQLTSSTQQPNYSEQSTQEQSPVDSIESPIYLTQPQSGQEYSSSNSQTVPIHSSQSQEQLSNYQITDATYQPLLEPLVHHTQSTINLSVSLNYSVQTTQASLSNYSTQLPMNYLQPQFQTSSYQLDQSSTLETQPSINLPLSSWNSINPTKEQSTSDSEMTLNTQSSDFQLSNVSQPLFSQSAKYQIQANINYPFYPELKPIHSLPELPSINASQPTINLPQQHLVSSQTSFHKIQPVYSPLSNNSTQSTELQSSTYFMRRPIISVSRPVDILQPQLQTPSYQSTFITNYPSPQPPTQPLTYLPQASNSSTEEELLINPIQPAQEHSSLSKYSSQVQSQPSLTTYPSLESQNIEVHPSNYLLQPSTDSAQPDQEQSSTNSSQSEEEYASSQSHIQVIHHIQPTYKSHPGVQSSSHQSPYASNPPSPESQIHHTESSTGTSQLSTYSAQSEQSHSTNYSIELSINSPQLSPQSPTLGTQPSIKLPQLSLDPIKLDQKQSISYSQTTTAYASQPKPQAIDYQSMYVLQSSTPQLSTQEPQQAKIDPENPKFSIVNSLSELLSLIPESSQTSLSGIQAVHAPQSINSSQSSDNQIYYVPHSLSPQLPENEFYSPISPQQETYTTHPPALLGLYLKQPPNQPSQPETNPKYLLSELIPLYLNRPPQLIKTNSANQTVSELQKPSKTVTGS